MSRQAAWWRLRRAFYALLVSSCFSLTASAQFRVVDNFTINSSGQSFAFDGSGVDAYIAQQNIAAAIRQVAIIGLNAVQYANQKYFIPMKTLERQITYAQRNSDSASARALTAELLDQ